MKLKLILKFKTLKYYWLNTAISSVLKLLFLPLLLTTSYISLGRANFQTFLLISIGYIFWVIFSNILSTTMADVYLLQRQGVSLYERVYQSSVKSLVDLLVINTIPSLLLMLGFFIFISYFGYQINIFSILCLISHAISLILIMLGLQRSFPLLASSSDLIMLFLFFTAGVFFENPNGSILEQIEPYVILTSPISYQKSLIIGDPDSHITLGVITCIYLIIGLSVWIKNIYERMDTGVW